VYGLLLFKSKNGAKRILGVEKSYQSFFGFARGFWERGEARTGMVLGNRFCQFVFRLLSTGQKIFSDLIVN